MEDRLDFVPLEIVSCLSSDILPLKIDKENIFKKNKKKNVNCDVKDSKIVKLPKYFDITSIRGEEINKLKIMEKKPSTISIIPKEYWMIKEDLVRFIQYSDRELESLSESDKKQIVFPTETPSSRYEVKCLEETLRRMLEDIGRPDEIFANYTVESRDDIDHLIELVLGQQEVYNMILHELGRQVMTWSFDGGNTVLELRNKYSALIKNIPEELSRLKEEVKEQVIRDKKLLTQIDHFQSGIAYLTNQLKEVKNQDIKITKSAESLQRDLEAAMQDTARSKELLNEYHVLYDLQRQRLDQQMSSINLEKEEWSSLAFALSLKISDESLLNTTKRLRLITKKLIQLSQHFSIFISDCDTVMTSKIQDLSDRFLKILTKLHTNTLKILNNFYDLYHFLKTKFEFFTKREIVESKDQIKEILNQIMSLKGFLGDDTLKNFIVEISSGNIAHFGEEVIAMNDLVRDLRTTISEFSGRTGFEMDQGKESPLWDHLSEIYEAINKWSEHLSYNLDTMSKFQNFFQDFQSKVNIIEMEVTKIKISEDSEGKDVERTDLESITNLIDDLYIETFETSEFEKLTKNEDFSKFTQFYSDIQRTINDFSTNIDEYDAELMEKISQHQYNITHWIVDILFLLSNMTEANDLDIKYQKLCQAFEEFIVFNGRMFEYIIRWTEKLTISSGRKEDSRELEIEEYNVENNQWSDVAEILVRNIGDTIEQELVKRRKKSENARMKINLENIDVLIEEIAAKCSDNNIYLSVKSVRSLKSELDEIQQRIINAKDNKNELLTNLNETNDKINEYERKLEELTVEFCQYTKI